MSKGMNANQWTDEWGLMVKAVSFLAILTAFLYLRVMIDQGAPLSAGSTLLAAGAMRVAMTIVGILGLLAGWRWPVVGGAVAVIAGLLLGWQVYDAATHDPLLLALAYGSPCVITGALYIYLGRRPGRRSGGRRRPAAKTKG
jgi:hypothetical protein